MTVSPRPVVLSWSGGKDSILALDRLRADRSVSVIALLTSVSTEFDRISMHGVRRALLHRQAALLQLPVIEVELAPGPSNASYEAAFAAALGRLQAIHPAVRTVAFGDLFLQDVREYRDGILSRLGWTGLYPLWHEDTRLLADEFIGHGYRAVLTCVDTTQLPGSFVGREFDPALLSELPVAVDPCGERGEFHTFVYGGPLLGRGIAICRGERVLRDERFAYCDVIEAPERTLQAAP